MYTFAVHHLCTRTPKGVKFILSFGHRKRYCQYISVTPIQNPCKSDYRCEGRLCLWAVCVHLANEFLKKSLMVHKQVSLPNGSLQRYKLVFSGKLTIRLYRTDFTSRNYNVIWIQLPMNHCEKSLWYILKTAMSTD